MSLGMLWLLDGALQLQHQMFTGSFATQVIAPAIQGQPEFVAGPMRFGMHLFLMHPAIFNALFALTQLGLGLLVLWKRTTKLGLLLSVPWGMIVWAFGEGYGGIFSGHTLLLMGAPGAVILYVLLALAVLPSKTHKQTAYWLALIWLVIWIGGGVYQLLPGQNSTTEVASMIAGSVQGAPGWLASLDTHTAAAISTLGKTNGNRSVQPETSMDMTAGQMTHMSNQSYVSSQSDPGGLYILLFAMVQFGIGIGVLFAGRWRASVIVLGIALSILFWVVGESLGGYYTGVATDPNAAPLFIIMGLAIVATTDMDGQLTKLAYKIQSATIGKPSGDDS